MITTLDKYLNDFDVVIENDTQLKRVFEVVRNHTAKRISDNRMIELLNEVITEANE